MAGKTTIRELDKLAEQLSWLTKMDYFVDRRLGQPQLMERTAEGNRRDVSPMMTAGQLADWIRVFTHGARSGIFCPAAKNEWRRR
jgi:hypothetical protein